MFGNLSLPRLIEVISDVADGPDFDVCKLGHDRRGLERLRGDAIAEGFGFGNGSGFKQIGARTDDSASEVTVPPYALMV